MKRILIAEDESHLRFLLEQTLEDLTDHGVEIESVENGQLALKSIEACKPDILFLDVMMPLVNGFEVCETIKGNDATKDIFVIMLTAKGQEIDRIRGESAGANLYLTKPFDPYEIVKIAARHLDITLQD